MYKGPPWAKLRWSLCPDSDYPDMGGGRINGYYYFILSRKVMVSFAVEFDVSVTISKLAVSFYIHLP